MFAQQSIYDGLSEWERELVADYGLKKTLDVTRLGRGTRFSIKELEKRHGPPIKRR